MAEVIIEQNTKDWLIWRKDKICASDVSSILGVNKWGKTAYMLWEEKLSDEIETKSNPAMERGKALEEKARKCYEKLKQKSFLPYVGVRYDYPFLGASMDGFSLDKKHAVEIKCPGKDDHGTAMNGQVPVHYMPQLQHQMFVCDLPSIDYFSYVSDDDHVTLSVGRDDAYIADMLQKEIAFYKCMTSRTPPPLTDRDYEKRDDSEWANAVEEFKCAKFGLNISQEISDKARDRLIALSCNKSSKGLGIAVQKIVKQGQVDYSKIEELKDIDLNQYRKESTTIFVIREDKTS